MEILVEKHKKRICIQFDKVRFDITTEEENTLRVRKRSDTLTESLKVIPVVSNVITIE